ncbi:hypothetical protein ACFS3C_03505 [Azotobacter vinelandii]|uniref:hypothetical protein n=1 Tax=Azotobacter TaxID=352 RepID=UPI00158752AB|nr:hypothetical protein [Azotobacter vinelandii]
MESDPGNRAAPPGMPLSSAASRDRTSTPDCSTKAALERRITTLEEAEDCPGRGIGVVPGAMWIFLEQSDHLLADRASADTHTPFEESPPGFGATTVAAIRPRPGERVRSGIY